MDKWSPGNFFQGPIIGIIFSILVVTILLATICFVYYFKTKNMDVKKYDSKFVILVDAFIDSVKKIVIDNIGHKFIKFTPYIIFLFGFLLLSNMLALFGLKETTTSYTVPLTLGFVTWFTSILLSIKYQKMNYLKSFLIGAKIKNKKIYFMINPFGIIGKITPLISLTFRIWGNIIAGSIIYAVLFWACGSLVGDFPEIGILIVGGIIIMPAMLAYLTLFTGGVQAYVFVLLTVTYWSLGIYGDEGAQEENDNALEKTNVMENSNVTQSKALLK